MKDSGKLTIGELACLSIVLWRAWRGEDVSALLPQLRPTHQNKFDSLLRMLDASMKLEGLEVPRGVLRRSAARKLGETLRSALEAVGLGHLDQGPRAFPTRESHWETLAFLVVFVSQLERNRRKSEGGSRMVHVDVHCIAVYFALISSNTNRWDSIILTFIKAKELDCLKVCFSDTLAGNSFSAVVQDTRLGPAGLREMLRRVLDIHETVHTGIKQSAEMIRMSLDQTAIHWDAERDPHAQLVRVPGVVHERVLSKQLTERKEQGSVVAVAEPEHFGEAEIAEFLMDGTDEPLEVPRALTAQSFASVSKPSGVRDAETHRPAARKEAERSPPRPVQQGEPRSFDLISGLGFCLIMGLLLIFLGRDTYAMSVAWWHFSLGGLVVGASILVAWPILRWSILGEPLELV